jgi:PhnB protein
MAKTPLPIPPGYEHSTPYLTCKDAAQAIDFYKNAFGAAELIRMPMPDGKIGHAEIKIADAIVMLSDEFPEYGAQSPATLGGTTVGIMIYVPDVDAFAERAVAAGAQLAEPVKDQFYGDRSCRLLDPSGHKWFFATHIEDVAPDEMKRRAEKLFGVA